ncbi:hypothetical protein ACJJTC_015232 [Scirpophaga incertulas]
MADFGLRYNSSSGSAEANSRHSILIKHSKLFRRLSGILGLGNPDSRLFGDHCNPAGQWDSRGRPGVGTSSRTEEDEDNSVEVFAFTKVAIFQEAALRKYNMEEESKKLYGEDFKSVLRRFRKTSEYLSILKYKVETMKENYEDIFLNALEYFNTKIEEELKQKIYGTEDHPTPVFRKPLIGRHGPYQTIKIGRKSKKKLRDGDELNTISPTYRLDRYGKSHFSVEERNTFRDIAFKNVANAIETLVKNLGGSDDADTASTRQPIIKDEVKTTVANKEPTNGSTVGEEVNEGETFERARGKKDVHRQRG